MSIHSPVVTEIFETLNNSTRLSMKNPMLAMSSQIEITK